MVTNLEMAFNRNKSVQPRSRVLFEGADVTAPVPHYRSPDTDAATHATLTRSVYCVLGLPIDAVNLASVVQRIEGAALNRATLLISSPNLNLLVSSVSDPEFGESLLGRGLSPPDRTTIVWTAQLLGS